MAWSLVIHQIDVDQGDCTLIEAIEDSDSNKIFRRGMLIDAGRAGQAAGVHEYIQKIFKPAELATVVVSSYDADHAGGILDLLRSDTMGAMVTIVVEALEEGYKLVKDLISDDEKLVAMAAMLNYACVGGYATNGYKNNLATLCNDCLDYFRTFPPKNISPTSLRRFGKLYAYHFLEDDFDDVVKNQILNPRFNQIANTAKNPIIPDVLKNGKVSDIEIEAIYNLFFSKIKVSRKRDSNQQSISQKPTPVKTDKTYHNISIFDIGLDTRAALSEEYERTVDGDVLLSQTRSHVHKSILKRDRVTPALGKEIFWHGVQPPVANAPKVYVWAINREVRQGKSSKTLHDTDDNAKSIGLVVKLNGFYYYLGGDLPKEAEELIWADLTSNNDRPWGKEKPSAMWGFKAGHHGAKTSTSAKFVKDSKAKVCLISCGKNRQFEHPTDECISVLNDKNDGVQGFFLTGCKAGVKGIPGANGLDQFTVNGNKAWLSGHDWIARGHIKLLVNQASTEGKNDKMRVMFVDIPPLVFTEVWKHKDY